MTKETINGRFIITKTAYDFVDDFTTLEEVDFRDMADSANKQAIALCKGHQKENVKVESYPAEMKIVISYDKK